MPQTTELADGEYLIVNEDFSKAFDGSLDNLDDNPNLFSVTISSNKIESNATVNAATFTITKVDNNYTIQSASGYYIGRTADSNGMNTSATDSYNHSIKFIDGNAIITSSGGPKLQCLNNSSSPRFRYYKSSQKAIQLYKKVSVTISEKELAALSAEDLNTFTEVSASKTANDVVTGIADMGIAKTVSGVKYYNLMGAESDRPFEGVNIVVTRFSDGSSQTVKVMK